jgi:hypothetical protein
MPYGFDRQVDSFSRIYSLSALDQSQMGEAALRRIITEKFSVFFEVDRQLISEYTEPMPWDDDQELQPIVRQLQRAYDNRPASLMDYRNMNHRINGLEEVAKEATKLAKRLKEQEQQRKQTG